VSVDIFIKSYRANLHWLSYCLQFLEKNWREKSRFIVLLDPDCAEVVKDWGVKNVDYLFTPPWPDGYMHALYCKMTADRMSDAELILLLDSDTLLLEPCGLGDITDNGRPLIEYLHWDRPDDDAGRKLAHRLWTRVTRESMAIELEVDYMVTHAWLFHRSTFVGARNIITEHKGARNFEHAVYSAHPYDWTQYEFHPFTFCDLEALYLYGAKFEPDRYSIGELDYGKYRRPFHDFWSHTPFTPELQAKLDGLLMSQ
jgi:hypothetical protein